MITRIQSGLCALVLLALIASGIAPFDRTTWLLEVAPVLIGLPVLAATRRQFPLSALLYIIIAVHCVVLIAGGAWSYARVPLGFWIQHSFDLSRNPYDKIGHFMQGVTPSLLMYSFLRRAERVRGTRLAAILSICVALAFSACYELFEWISALLLGQGADEFLGTQGDVWDTQSDMFMALIGASFAMLFLRKWTRCEGIGNE